MIGSMLIAALMQGLIYSPMALGVFIAFRILDTPDLTIDGSLVFGMTTCALVTIGGHPIIALFAGILAGALAGLVTGILQTKLHINAILAGILTMTGLYTVNYMVLGGQSNKYLMDESSNSSDTIYNLFTNLLDKMGLQMITEDANAVVLILTFFIVAALAVILILFFKTRTGMAIRATGDNEEMVRSSSIDSDFTRIIGIMIANAFVAFSGALLCEQQKYADLNCGTGMLVVGLASVIIGQVIFGKKGVSIGIISAIFGSLFYRVVLQIAYKIDLPSYSVKLLSAVIVALALSVPIVKNKYHDGLSKKRRSKVLIDEAKINE